MHPPSRQTDVGLESHLSSQIPAEGHHEGGERSGDGAVILDESAVKVGKPQESLQMLRELGTGQEVTADTFAIPRNPHFSAFTRSF